MALPKRRHSVTRGRKRRTHWKLGITELATCPQCKQKKSSHRICPSCGYYKGREVVKIESAAERKKRKESKRDRRK